jgi:hypothetical protein
VSLDGVMNEQLMLLNIFLADEVAFTCVTIGDDSTLHTSNLAKPAILKKEVNSFMRHAGLARLLQKLSKDCRVGPSFYTEVTSWFRARHVCSLHTLCISY